MTPRKPNAAQATDAIGKMKDPTTEAYLRGHQDVYAILPLVCLAYALLTHRRIERHGAQGQRTPHKAAELSTATAQEQLRRLLWEDLMTSLKAKRHGQSVIEALERLRMA